MNIQHHLMKSKSASKQKKIRNRIRRKSVKNKKKKRQSQNGGELEMFQLYFFTDHLITNPIKSKLMKMLIELYGDHISYTDDTNAFHNICKSERKDFVLKKGGEYKNKTHILGFNVNTFPAELTGVMDDSKLTHEENKIKMALGKKKLPFKLVKAPPGLWSPQLAIIAFETI